MGLESPTHIDDLVAANPVGSTDAMSTVDDHIRNLKTVLKTDFPDVNAATASYIVSATAPTTPVAGTRWHDTTLDVLKIRNKGNTAWITQVGSVVANNTVDINGGTIDGTTVVGGTIDNTPIGATTPSTGVFSTLNATTVTFLPAGTVMLFYQAAAPTGWTQVVTQNNKALRIVSGTGGGTGGTVAFTTAFASQAVAGTTNGTALTEAQLPSSLTVTVPVSNTALTAGNVAIQGTAQSAGSSVSASLTSVGSGSTHNHTFTGTAIDLAVQYIDLILASKD